MDSTVDLNKTIDLTADSSSDEEEDNDVIITEAFETNSTKTADISSGIPPQGAASLPEKGARTILMAEEVTASKFVDHNLNTYNDMRTGDLIEFHRGLYTHWGVAIGDGKIIHLSGDDDDGLRY